MSKERGIGVTGVLFALWIAVLAADRIDLVGGRASFVLTPFLVLTPVYLTAVGLWGVGLRRRVSSSGWSVAYGALLCIFLSIVLVSTFLATDPPSSARRSVLLVALALGGLLMAFVISQRTDCSRVLVAGAKLGVALALVFNVAEVWAFFAGSPPPLAFGPVSIDLAAATYAGFVPRLSGQVADPNRAGIVLLVYTFIIARWGTPGRVRTGWVAVGVLLLSFTLSRSNLLALAVTAVVALVADRSVRVRPGTVLASLAGLALTAGFLLASPPSRESAARWLSPLESRFSIDEGSSQDHLRLLERGAKEATSSVKRAAIGVGYGNSYLLLQDVFPGNKYGNFHSMYVTLAAEAGAIALVFGLLLVGVPLVIPGPFRPLIAGIAVFNIFYQSLAEPVFWFVLALAWMALRVPAKPAREIAPAGDG